MQNSLGKVATLTIALAVASCGGPSPWSNTVPWGQDTNLTTKALRRLGGTDLDFEPFSFGLIADSQGVPGYLRLVGSRLEGRGDLAFALILGDLTDRSLRKEFVWIGDVVDESSLPILTVVGNHDGLIYGEEIYEQVFGDLDYSFVYRGIKFVLWNNNPYEWGYPDFDWLEREVESHPRVIIAAHQPPGRIERYPEANDRLNEIYQHPHVLGSVHGHTHQYKSEQIAGKPVLTVDRVADEYYAIMHVQSDLTLDHDRCRGAECPLPD